MVEDETYNVEEMTLESGREDVVRLMNLHQAKGLEGRVVFLVDSGDSPRSREPNFHVTRTADVPYLSLPLRLAGRYHTEIIGQPAGWAEDAEEETRFLSGEALRLIYVAATRARNLLVISHYQRKSGSGPWDILYPFLGNIPELECPTLDIPAEEHPEPIDLEAFNASLKRKHDAVIQPTYEHRSVTEDDPGDAFQRAVSTEGRGKDYGSVIHHLLELAIKNALPKNEQGYIQMLMQNSNLEQYTDDALSALSSFRASDLWREIQASNSVYTEVPFATRLAAESPPTILRGILDLAISTPEGWILVDYKTDAIPDSNPDFLTKKYARQVESYAEHWKAISGEFVTEKGIWSTELGWVRI
jgi:ATP-dependent helicase/nuclease subunit A